MNMTLGPQGVKLIKSFEGCRLAAYRDSGGILSIGFGHTSAAGTPTVTAGMTIGQAEAEAIFLRDTRKFVDRVNRLVKVPLKQCEFDALVSFDFNSGGLERRDPKTGKTVQSTLLKRLNAGRKDLVPAELMKWVKAKVGGEFKTVKGLVRRRQAEVDLWTADTREVAAPISAAAVEKAPPTKTMAQSKIGNAAIVGGVAGAAQVADAVSQAASSAAAAHDSVATLIRAAGLPLLLGLAVVGVAVAIWLWRRQNLRAEAQ